MSEFRFLCKARGKGRTPRIGGTNPTLPKALGYGKFILALNTPFNREVLGDYGILFDKSVGSLKEKLQHIVDHPEIAEGFRHRAPCRIKEAYSWESIADKYEVLFQRMISS